MIRIEKLTMRFADGTIGLENLDLEIGSGEVCALLGANGAGKSTTINILLGLLTPTSGSAQIGGIDVVGDSVSARRAVGYIPEQVALYDDLNAMENVRFFVELYGHRMTLPECRAALTKVGFPEAALRRKVRLLSKGMRQKVMIAAMCCRTPKALLLDEPTSGLDPRAASEFLDDLETLKADGCAILMATHDLLRVRTFADQVAIMDRGTVVARCRQPELAHQDLELLYLTHIGGRERNQPSRSRRVASGA